MKKIDTRKLIELSKSNRTAKAILSVLSSRERASKATNLAGFRHLMKKEFGYDKIDRAAFDETWEQLDKLGLGKLSRSKSGIPARFEWNGWNSHTVGMAAFDSSVHPETTKFRKRKPAKKQKASLQEVPKVETTPQVEEQHFTPSGEPGIPAERIFAIFQTNAEETIRLQFSRGLTRADKDRLLKLVNELPVQEAS